MKKLILLLALILPSVSHAQFNGCLLLAINQSQRLFFSQYGAVSGFQNGCIVVQQDNNVVYQWNGSSYSAIASSASGNAISQLTGDVTAGPGPGSVSSIVASVGGSTAANVHNAQILASAATDANTASTIIKRDASGNAKVSDPSAASDIATKNYVDTHAPSAANPALSNLSNPTAINQILTSGSNGVHTDFNIRSANQTTGASSDISLLTGTSGDDTSGGVTIKTGVGAVAVGSGAIKTQTGNQNSGGASGNNSMLTGAGDMSGVIDIFSGASNAGASGLVDIESGAAIGGASGAIDLTTGSSSTAASGNIILTTGAGISQGAVIVRADSLDMSSTQIHNVSDPSSAQDAATKNYVDSHIPSSPATAYIREELPQGTTGGNSAGTTFTVRLLNTVDDHGIGVTLSTNDLVGLNGTYDFDVWAPVYKSDQFNSRLQDVTANVTLCLGQTGFSLSSGQVMVASEIHCRATVPPGDSVEVQTAVGTAVVNGFGIAAGNLGDEVYTQVKIVQVQ